MDTDVNLSTVLGIALGYLIAQGLRRLAKSKFWGAVFSRAGVKLADPSVPEIDDPMKAAESALLEMQKANVVAVAQKLANNSNGK